jgi:hypothetical protein
MLIRIEPDPPPKLSVFLQNSGFQVSLTQGAKCRYRVETQTY